MPETARSLAYLKFLQNYPNPHLINWLFDHKVSLQYPWQWVLDVTGIQLD